MHIANLRRADLDAACIHARHFLHFTKNHSTCCVFSAIGSTAPNLTPSSSPSRTFAHCERLPIPCPLFFSAPQSCPPCRTLHRLLRAPPMIPDQELNIPLRSSEMLPTIAGQPRTARLSQSATFCPFLRAVAHSTSPRTSQSKSGVICSTSSPVPLAPRAMPVPLCPQLAQFGNHEANQNPRVM